MSLFYQANGIIKDNRIREHFLGGFLAGAISGGLSKHPEKNLEKNTKIQTAIQNTSNINREMIVNAINNINNQVANEVAQKNSAEISNSLIAENKINFEQSTVAGDFNVVGNTLSNQAEARTLGNIKQESDSKIKTDITTEITKKITNQIPDDQAVADRSSKRLAAQAMRNVQASLAQLNANSPVSQAASQGSDLVSGIMNTFLPGSKENVNIKENNEINQSLKEVFNLDDTFKVNDENNISNEISNIVDQANYANCKSSLLAQNEMTFRNLDVGGSVNISNNKLLNIANSYLECVIDQDISSQITTKIVSKIESNIEKLVGEIAEKSPDKLPLFINAADAATKTLIDSAYPEGNYPSNIELNEEPEEDNQEETAPSTPSTTAPSTPSTPAPSTPAPSTPSTPATNVEKSFLEENIIYIIVGIVIFFLFLILIILLSSGGNSRRRYDYYDDY